MLLNGRSQSGAPAPPRVTPIQSAHEAIQARNSSAFYPPLRGFHSSYGLLSTARGQKKYQRHRSRLCYTALHLLEPVDLLYAMHAISSEGNADFYWTLPDLIGKLHAQRRS